jgi:hypothetical protein
MSTKDAEREVLASLVEELRYLHGTQTEMIAHLRSQAVNGVLEVATLALDSTGALARSYNTAAGSVLVVNTTPAAITVQSGGQSGSTAPPTGRGVSIIPAATSLPVPIGAHSFTIYGTPGAIVSFQVFTGLQAFGIAR